jgi:7-carboxy-7-deazaguanine synthase
MSDFKQLKRIEDKAKTLPIAEIYTAVQSEGSRAGMPTVVIRTTGCTHRCFFGEGGWCDSWYTSIHPDKGSYSFNDIVAAYDKNPHISEMMLTGGSPSMHGALVNELTHFANERNIVITMETEGSHFLTTDYPIGLLSISPKFSNSVPVLGVKTPLGKITDEKMIKQHNKKRMNTEAIKASIEYHTDYHIKPVWGGSDYTELKEITDYLEELEVEEHKVYFMPAGDSRESLQVSYPLVFDWVRDNGYRMTWRPHIIAFEDQREV